jgi:hypothetical protein
MLGGFQSVLKPRAIGFSRAASVRVLGDPSVREGGYTNPRTALPEMDLIAPLTRRANALWSW